MTDMNDVCKVDHTTWETPPVGNLHFSNSGVGSFTPGSITLVIYVAQISMKKYFICALHTFLVQILIVLQI